jgi:hypothetical protein
MENTSAQRDSKFSKFKKNQTLHGLHGEEMYSAQQDSKFSKSGNRPFSPLCLLCPFCDFAVNVVYSNRLTIKTELLPSMPNELLAI